MANFVPAGGIRRRSVATVSVVSAKTTGLRCPRMSLQNVRSSSKNERCRGGLMRSGAAALLPARRALVVSRYSRNLCRLEDTIMKRGCTTHQRKVKNARHPRLFAPPQQPFGNARGTLALASRLSTTAAMRQGQLYTFYDSGALGTRDDEFRCRAAGKSRRGPAAA